MLYTFLISKVSFLTSSPNGHIRLNFRYAEALKETINIIVFEKFPEIVKINHSSKVYLL